MENKFEQCIKCVNNLDATTCNLCNPVAFHDNGCKYIVPSEYIPSVTAMAEYDEVKHPKHYQLSIAGYEIEAKDVIKAVTRDMDNGYAAYCLGNIFKYLLRFKNKNGLQDIQKARQYIEFLVKEMEEDEDANIPSIR